MELREAFKVLGVETVRRGMRAIDDRRGGDPRASDGCSCFIGEAFGGNHFFGVFNVDRRLAVAAATCEAWYEGWWAAAPRYPEQGKPAPLQSWQVSRAELRAECIAFLAEHGDAVEPTAAPHRDNAVVGA